MDRLSKNIYNLDYIAATVQIKHIASLQVAHWYDEMSISHDKFIHLKIQSIIYEPLTTSTNVSNHYHYNTIVKFERSIKCLKQLQIYKLQS